MEIIKKRIGHPLMLTEESQEIILKALRLGATYKLAAQAAGVHYTTFNTWMKKGEVEEEGIYSNFYKDVKKAEQDDAEYCLQKIREASNKGTWQAAAWKLERRHWEGYGANVADKENAKRLEKLEEELGLKKLNNNDS